MYSQFDRHAQAQQTSHQYYIYQMNRYQTINTFTRTPVCTQVSAYIVYIGECLTFFLCMYPNYHNQTARTVILICYIATATIQALVSVICSYIDPSDSTMIQFRNNRAKTSADLRDCLYCDICQSYVKESSRHCRQCQRCVQNFDHHCIWINNCIGSKNYRLFFFMISITLINMVVYLVGMGLLWSEGKWRQYLGQMIALWIFSLLVVIFSFLLANLILLHIYLTYKGLTTYQFIMLEREQQKKKQQEREKEKEKRVLQQERDQHEITIIPVIKQKQKNGQSKIHTFIKQQNRSNSANQNIIFGNYVSSSHNTDKESQNQLSQNKENKEVSHQGNNENNSLQSKNASSVNLSQFFTRNKSLKFLVGDQVGQRPKTSKMHNQQQKYASLKMISNQRDKIKNIRQKQQQKQRQRQKQYSTQKNRKNQSQVDLGKLNQLKVFPRK